MASGRAIFQAQVDGTLQTIPIDAQWTFATGLIGAQTQGSFGSGDNTLTIPSGTKVILVIPPTTNAATLKWKGAGGDTGTTMSPTLPYVGTYSAGSVIINASSSVNPVAIYYFG